MANFNKSHLRAIIKESIKEIVLENRDKCNNWLVGTPAGYNGFMADCCISEEGGCDTYSELCSVYYSTGLSYLSDPCDCCRYGGSTGDLDCNENPTGKCWGCRGQGSACEQLDQIPMAVPVWQSSIGNPLYPDLLACQAGISNGEACGDSGGGTEDKGCEDPNATNYNICCNGDPNCTVVGSNQECCRYEDDPEPCDICCCKKQGAPMGEQIRRGNPGPSEPVGGCKPGSIVNALSAPTIGTCSCDALSGYMQVSCGPTTPPTNTVGMSESAMKTIIRNMLKK